MLKIALAALFMLFGATAFAGNVSTLSGPQDPSQLNATINTLIISGNTSWNPSGSGFVNSNAVSANSTSTITITNVGPLGLSPSTIVEWLKIRNASGTYRLIPMWGCPAC